MYICPGCCYTSKQGFGNTCKKCNYQITESPNRFPRIEELINGTYPSTNTSGWNDVDLQKLIKTIFSYYKNDTNRI